MFEDWKPVSKVSVTASAICAIAFWVHALADNDGFLILDYANLPFHEFGHLFFGLFGDALGIWGGTLFQLLIPLSTFGSFFFKRECTGVAFSAFWFGENLLNISVYIADARKMQLPLVGSGDHDWNIILSDLGMLQFDSTLAGIVKAGGWLIMISALAWLIYRGVKSLEME